MRNFLRTIPVGVLVLGAALAMSTGGANAQLARGTYNDPEMNIDKRPAMDEFQYGELYEDAVEYLNKGQFTEAERKFETMIGVQSKFPPKLVPMINYLMGRTKMGLQKYPDAKKYMETAVKLDPEMAAPRGYIGALEYTAGNMDAVKEQLLKLDSMKTQCKSTCAQKADIDNAIKLIMAQRPAAAPSGG